MLVPICEAGCLFEFWIKYFFEEYLNFFPLMVGLSSSLILEISKMGSTMVEVAKIDGRGNFNKLRKKLKLFGIYRCVLKRFVKEETIHSCWILKKYWGRLYLPPGLGITFLILSSTVVHF
ncbi:uncharacterized protein LOC133311341 [Gastrolobium bilobum]|uniref:uncharacterized protein LOC133311341 n=1 Tax=Gastrolobium bilobum TaxID=150636 RepID=UPI002AB13D64|nr:uncharacterized protein LOC133311341 [Gastrolobium bilobum]